MRPGSTLNRASIVAVAVEIADRDGIAMVSLRHVAKALHAGPMRLYSFIETKEYLLDLMTDSVYAEMSVELRSRTDWKVNARLIAACMRAAVRKHSWFVQLLGGRPHQGPNALMHIERCLSTFAMAEPALGIDRAVQAVTTFHAFVMGALQSELRAIQAQRDSGLTQEEWQEAAWPYLCQMLETGRFPKVSKVVRCGEYQSPDRTFDVGLECVLHGLEANFSRPLSRRF